MVLDIGPEQIANEHFDLVAIGSGFGSAFFPLPIEKIFDRGIRPTESHVQGTLRMGLGPADSVVDRDMIHHQLRNLVVVATSTYPSCSCANPSLTAAALSLRAASRIE